MYLPEERTPVPKFVLIAILVLSVGVIAMIILIGLKRPDSSTHTGSIEFVEVTQEVAPGQDIVIGVNNATLYVPKGATTLPGLITITTRAPNLFSNAPEKGWVRSPVVNVEYWNGLGTPYPQVSFTVSVQVCFKITSELWQDYTNHPDEFQVQYYAEAQNPPRWEPLLLTANPDRLQLCGQTDHLSIFALAVWQRETIPVSGPISNPNPTLIPPPTPYSIFGFFKNLFGLNPGDVGLTPIVVPPVVTTEPPATNPPATEPPATNPPATEPPNETEPPATEPPNETEPPVVTEPPPPTDPPTTEPPPPTDPPATEPPATEPPPTEAPIVP